MHAEWLPVTMVANTLATMERYDAYGRDGHAQGGYFND